MQHALTIKEEILVRATTLKLLLSIIIMWACFQARLAADENKPIVPTQLAAPAQGIAAPLGENDSILDAPAADATTLFQEFKTDFTYLPGAGRNGFGIEDFGMSARFALPTLADWAPLQITP